MCFSIALKTKIQKIQDFFDCELDFEAVAQFKQLLKIEQDFGKEKTLRLLGENPKSKRKSPIFKTRAEDGIIYSNYFAPVIVLKDSKLKIIPMRYRVRPQHSKQEVPSKYNVFNARRDSLYQRKTWKNIILKNHGLVPFDSFFEWVEDQGKPRLIRFFPKNKELMWAPCLWDSWQSDDKSIQFCSFAIITDEPPLEVSEKGHDRCPIFLEKKMIHKWLDTKNLDKDKVENILQLRENEKFSSQWYL